jgi:hypothetical protein
LKGAYCASAHGILTERIIQQALLFCQEKKKRVFMGVFYEFGSKKRQTARYCG